VTGPRPVQFCGVIIGATRLPCALPAGHDGDWHRDRNGKTAAVHNASERERREQGVHIEALRRMRAALPNTPRPVMLTLPEFDALLAAAAERDEQRHRDCDMPDEQRVPGPALEALLGTVKRSDPT
jgi:hypothetical protein